MPSHERYNYLYSEQELLPWAGRIEHVAEHAKTTFVVTNNHFEGKGVVNALQLIHMLTHNKVKIPEPLRHRYPALEADRGRAIQRANFVSHAAQVELSHAAKSKSSRALGTST